MELIVWVLASGPCAVSETEGLLPDMARALSDLRGTLSPQPAPGLF